MEGCDHLQELWRTPNSFQKGKETVSAHQVEGLGQVNEGKVKWASLFAALLLKLSEGECHVDCRSLCTEPALRLWVNAVSQQLQFAKHDASKGLSYDAEKGYPTIIVAIAALALVLVERDNLSVPHVLGYRALLPALEQEIVQVAEKRTLTC